MNSTGMPLSARSPAPNPFHGPSFVSTGGYHIPNPHLGDADSSLQPLTSEFLRREQEKARIKLDVITRELARRRLLEDEVRGELIAAASKEAAALNRKSQLEEEEDEDEDEESEVDDDEEDYDSEDDYEEDLGTGYILGPIKSQKEEDDCSDSDYEPNWSEDYDYDYSEDDVDEEDDEDVGDLGPIVVVKG